VELVLLFAVFLGTAVLPVVGAEAFLVAFMALHHAAVPWWVAGPVAAAGQLTGKAVHVLLAGRAAALPRVRRRIAGLTARCRARPRSATGVVLLSATVGVPPFTAVVPAVAAAGLDLRRLVPVAALGRTARFTALAAVPALVGLLPG
jgi:membrane protein YqaA with SNARE-associated domain